jgi:hypothetical protein
MQSAVFPRITRQIRGLLTFLTWSISCKVLLHLITDATLRECSASISGLDCSWPDARVCCGG